MSKKNITKKSRDKQFAEVVIIQGAVKTTIQMLYDKCLFDNNDIADEVLNDFLIVEKRKRD